MVILVKHVLFIGETIFAGVRYLFLIIILKGEV
jgi:hypothetical protein